MIYHVNKLVNIAFISICVDCEHLMKEVTFTVPKRMLIPAALVLIDLLKCAALQPYPLILKGLLVTIVHLSALLMPSIRGHMSQI